MVEELRCRQESDGLCEHAFSIDAIKEALLCNNNEAVKVRCTLKSLGWVSELPAQTPQLTETNGRKKALVRLTHEEHLNGMDGQSQTWQYKVVAGLLCCPPSEGWKLPPDELRRDVKRVERQDNVDGTKTDKIRWRLAHVAKLPIIERLALAALWAQASPVGKVEGISLNELARQCSLKPSKRFQLAISHLIVDGAITYVQEKVTSGDIFREKLKVGAEIQLNPFHPWVAEHTPPVTLLAIETDVSGVVERMEYPETLSTLTGIEGIWGPEYSFLAAGVAGGKTGCLMAVAYAANPYNPNGMNKRWSNQERAIRHLSIEHATEQYAPFTVSANIKALHDNFIIVQKLIRNHLIKKLSRSITHGELASGTLMLDVQAGAKNYYSPTVSDRYRAKLEKLPPGLLKIISNAEMKFQEKLLQSLLGKLEKGLSRADIAKLHSPHMVILPFDPPEVQTEAIHNPHFSMETIRWLVLTDCEGKVPQKRMIELGVNDFVPNIGSIDEIRNLKKF
ncbi:MAG: hypothetical protein IPK30_05505 [Cellvibrionales bacterium]|nr:hypothetical protein [Cellvibrionales bacterium]